MDQLTPKEWAREQIKRAPSFAVAFALMAGLLILSTFVEYTSAKPKSDFTPVEAEIAEEEKPQLDEIKEQINPEKPDLKPVADAPVVDDKNAEGGNLDAPVADINLNTDFTEDETSTSEASDPFPMELTRKMAVIGTSDTGGGGFRGALGNRTAAGKRSAARRFGMPAGTDKDILAALRWLAKVQNKETGGWDFEKLKGSADRSRGVSALALLAFLAYGCTDQQPPEFAPVVKKALAYLLNAQHKGSAGAANNLNGSFGEQMYTQGICTMALAEAYAMTGRIDCKRAAQAGLDYIIQKQPSHGGFSYGGPGNDCSVTGFQMQAFKAALVAGLELPKTAMEKAERYLYICMAKDHSSPYQVNPNAEVQNSAQGRPTTTAAMLTARLFLGHKRTAPDVLGQAEYLTAANRHEQMGKQAGNYYGIYYYSLSMFQMGGKYWKDWNAAYNEPLRARQVKTGPDTGSWDGGNAYSTAMATLALEVYFRYLPSYKSF